MLRGLSQFVMFDTARFFEGKTFIVAACEPWVDFDTKEVKGTKVNVLIREDRTSYRQVEGKKPITNLYKNLDIKVEGKNIDIPIDTPVVPINPTASIYGEFRNELSVTAEDLQPVRQQQPQPAPQLRQPQRRA